MTKEERKKAIDALKMSVPVIPMTQEEFDDYIKTLNKIMDLLEQEPETVTEFADRCRECGKMRKGHWILMGGRYIKCSECGHITKTESPDIYHFCMVCGTKMSENPTYPESEGKNDAHI